MNDLWHSSIEMNNFAVFLFRSSARASWPAPTLQDPLSEPRFCRGCFKHPTASGAKILVGGDHVIVDGVWWSVAVTATLIAAWIFSALGDTSNRGSFWDFALTLHCVRVLFVAAGVLAILALPSKKWQTNPSIHYRKTRATAQTWTKCRVFAQNTSCARFVARTKYRLYAIR